VRKILALVAAATALAVAAGAALATGVLNREIVQVPPSEWLQHFQEQHHGSAGKGAAAPPGEAATVADAQRRVGFRVHTLNGVAGADLTTWGGPPSLMDVRGFAVPIGITPTRLQAVLRQSRAPAQE
jgi:hypothetical protein